MDVEDIEKEFDLLYSTSMLAHRQGYMTFKPRKFKQSLNDAELLSKQPWLTVNCAKEDHISVMYAGKGETSCPSVSSSYSVTNAQRKESQPLAAVTNLNHPDLPVTVTDPTSEVHNKTEMVHATKKPAPGSSKLASKCLEPNGGRSETFIMPGRCTDGGCTDGGCTKVEADTNMEADYESDSKVKLGILSLARCCSNSWLPPKARSEPS